MELYTPSFNIIMVMYNSILWLYSYGIIHNDDMVQYNTIQLMVMNNITIYNITISSSCIINSNYHIHLYNGSIQLMVMNKTTISSSCMINRNYM